VLLDGLKADGVPAAFTKVEPQTRLCTTVIDKAAGTVTELVEESAPVDPADYVGLFRTCTRLIHTGGAKFPRPARVCVLSGSLTPGGDLEVYPDVIDYVTGLGGHAILDTRGKALKHALRCDRFTVKLNRQELAETVGEPLGTDDRLKAAMRDVCPDGGSVLVTMGGDGAVAWDGQQFWHIPAPSVKAVNPIGSGDAFAAGLAVARTRDLPPPEAYALAAACGAANALHPRAGYVDPKQVERLRKNCAGGGVVRRTAAAGLRSARERRRGPEPAG
jgi:tagatose 6-phosphate kinase